MAKCTTPHRYLPNLLISESRPIHAHLAWRLTPIDISCTINPMSPFKLPASGEDLAHAVRGYVDEAYDDAKSQLEWKYLPQGLAAIWECSPLLKEARKALPEPLMEIREICHIIVTFPGSTAVDRIRELLIQAQIVPNSEGQFERAHEMASELFTLTMRYTRVQNLARHIRTAVNSHLKVLHIETRSDRSRNSSLYEGAMPRVQEDEFIRTRIFQLRDAKLKTEQDVDDWANDVNNLLSLTSGSGIMTTERLERTKRAIGTVNGGAVNSYKLRFKQAIASTLGIDLADRNVRIEKTSNKSIERLLSELEDLPTKYEQLYQMLENLRPKRVSRPDALRGDFIYEFKSLGNENTKKNLLKHVLSIGGRELIIEGSRGAFTSDMVSGVLKTFNLQLSIDPDAPELRAAFESRGQILRVQIEQPKKSDHRKITEIFLQLI